VPQSARVFYSKICFTFGARVGIASSGAKLASPCPTGVPKMEFRWIVFLVLWTLLTGPIMARPSLVTSHASAKATKTR
jgi:hypothetical protein